GRVRVPADGLLLGLRYNEKAIAPGAQTKRPGDAGPVRALLGGENAPAALLVGKPRVIAFFKALARQSRRTTHPLRHNLSASVRRIAAGCVRRSAQPWRLLHGLACRKARRFREPAPQEARCGDPRAG